MQYPASEGSVPLRPVIITRPQHMAQNLVTGLQQVGRKSIVFPLFDIESVSDNSEMDRAISNLHQYALVMFVSPNAVDALFRRMMAMNGNSLRWPSTTMIAVVGSASRQALKQYGVDSSNAHIVSPRNEIRTDSETLLAELDLTKLVGQQVLIVRADSGREFFADALRNAQVNVDTITAYRRVVPELDASRRQSLKSYLDAAGDWVITSSSVLTTLLDWCSQLDHATLHSEHQIENQPDSAVAKMQQQQLYVPHFRIAEVARELGFKHIRLTASGDEKLILALQSSL